jgi:hypothetical protein
MAETLASKTRIGESKAAPFVADGSSDGPSTVCAACALPNEPGADRCARCARFLSGNQAAVTTGLRSRQRAIEVRAEAEALMAGIIADRGGEADLSTLQRALIQQLGSLAVMLRLLVDDIAENDLLSPGRAPRRVYEAYLAGLATFDRLAQRIGLQRTARSVNSIADFMERAPVLSGERVR